MTEKIQPGSSWNYPPLPKQTRRIALLAQQLGITEPIENSPTTRLEARNLIYELRRRRKEKDNAQIL